MFFLQAISDFKRLEYGPFKITFHLKLMSITLHFSGFLHRPNRAHHMHTLIKCHPYRLQF